MRLSPNCLRSKWNLSQRPWPRARSKDGARSYILALSATAHRNDGGKPARRRRYVSFAPTERLVDAVRGKRLGMFGPRAFTLQVLSALD